LKGAAQVVGTCAAVPGWHCDQPIAANISRTLRRFGDGVAQSIDRRLFVGAINAESVGIAAILAMPMAKHVVIAACPSELRKYVVTSCR
jgi:hypothetical protein